MSTFALPAEVAGMASNLGSSVGWSGSVGTLMGNPDLVAWQGGTSIGTGGSADFWFTTVPTDLALTNGFISNAGLTTLPAGFVAAPVPAPLPNPPMPRLVGTLVATSVDKNTPNEGLTSLREAIDWVNLQELPQQLEVRFTAGSAGLFLLNQQLPQITSNIFINGAGHNITVGRNAALGNDFRLIQGHADSTIKITGLVLENGGGVNFNGNGGAIATDGDLTLQDCIIRKNRAINGGGVYCADALIIEGCAIEENQAGSGGGIFAAGSLTLRLFGTKANTVFNNKAVANGGGISARSGVVDIRNTTVSLNEVGTLVNPGFGLGGGIFVGDRVTQALIRNTDILNNIADGRGGGVHITGGGVVDGVPVITTTTIRECSIYENRAQRGGGVAIMKDTLTVEYTAFSNNKAESAIAGFGGGVYVGDRVTAVSFTQSGLTGNEATTSGGGLWLEVPQAGVTLAVTLDATQVIANRAANQGGGIGTGWQAAGGTLQMTLNNDTRIEGNTVTAQGSVGGGLYLGYGTVTFDGVTFNTNIAGGPLATGYYVKSGAQALLGPGGVTVINDTWFIEP
jgi:predicted outer membrane repeat protein